jgi:hypothetical protein
MRVIFRNIVAAADNDGYFGQQGEGKIRAERRYRRIKRKSHD